MQGDTTTVLSAALACFYRRIPVGHVEAGLRSGDLTQPFPEEGNRLLATRLATLHFPPTTVSESNLRRDGVPAERITVTGNTVIDALHAEVARQEGAGVTEELDAGLATFLPPAALARPYVLITGHRRENFGGGFEGICAAIARLAERVPGDLVRVPGPPEPGGAGAGEPAARRAWRTCTCCRRSRTRPSSG